MKNPNLEHITGYILAVILTAIPFGAVWSGAFPASVTIALIAIAAIVQVCVHLRFFLGIKPGGGNSDNTYALLFAIVLMFIMVGGTLWIMASLNSRMMG